MPDAKLRVAIGFFPNQENFIINLAERSSQFHSLCADLAAVSELMPNLVREDERLEYSRLQSELVLELSEWLGGATTGNLDSTFRSSQ